jgi:hypothetical protein
LARLGVRGTFSQPGPSHPAASGRLTRTLGVMNPPFHIARAGWASIAVAVFFLGVALYFATESQPGENELARVTGKVADVSESGLGVHFRLSEVSQPLAFTYSHINGSSALVLSELSKNLGREVTVGHKTMQSRTIGTDEVLSISIEGRSIRSASEVSKERLKRAAMWWGIALIASVYAGWRVKVDRHLQTHDA